jgi:hypothetical protein
MEWFINFLSQFLDFNGEHLAVYPDTFDLEVYSQYVVSSSRVLM